MPNEIRVPAHLTAKSALASALQHRIAEAESLWHARPALGAISLRLARAITHLITDENDRTPLLRLALWEALDSYADHQHDVDDLAAASAYLVGMLSIAPSLLQTRIRAEVPLPDGPVQIWEPLQIPFLDWLYAVDATSFHIERLPNNPTKGAAWIVASRLLTVRELETFNLAHTFAVA